MKYKSLKINIMKKLFLITVILCLATTFTNAQVRFGVKAGANFSNLYVSKHKEGINADQYNGRFSYHFGGVMEYSVSRMFSIQPELLYMNQGANLKKENSFGMKDGHITLNSLQLPVNLKASFDLGNKKLFVYGGPYISYNIYAKAKGKIDGKTHDVELLSKNSELKRFDYGFGIGVGMEINKFTLTLGNQIGHQDINKGNGKMKTGSLTLSAGYFF